MWNNNNNVSAVALGPDWNAKECLVQQQNSCSLGTTTMAGVRDDKHDSHSKFCQRVVNLRYLSPYPEEEHPAPAAIPATLGALHRWKY